jgi:hypothetical protein
MASRWMQAKLARMALDRVNPRDPNAKPYERPRSGHTIEASNARSAELAKLCKGYTGVVTVGPKFGGKCATAAASGTHSYAYPKWNAGGLGARGGSVRALDLHEWSETATWALVRR